MKKTVGEKKINSKKARKSAPTKFWKTVRYIALLIIWVICSTIVSQLVVGMILSLFLSLDQLNKPVWSGVYSLASYAITLLLVVFVPPMVVREWGIRSKKKDDKKEKSDEETSETTAKITTREQLGLTGLPTWTDIGLSPVGYIVSTLMALALVWVFSLFPWFNAEQSQETGFSPYMNSGEKAIAFLVLVVLAPIVEEIIFRGWLYGKIRARMGAIGAILIVSALFGALHFQWNVGVNVFALSVVACVLREITGTIYAGIITHMIKNGVAFYLLYVLGFG